MFKKENKFYCPDHPKVELTEDVNDTFLLCLECDRTFPRPGHSGSSDEPGTSMAPSALRKKADVKQKSALMDPQYLDSILLKGFAIISSYAVRINLPQIVTNRAESLFRRVVEIEPNRNFLDEKTAACLHIALREENVPRTFQEMCSITGVPAKKIGQRLKWIQKKLELELTPMTPDQIMNRFCSRLELPRSVVIAANQIAKKAKNLPNMGGRTAPSVTAASIYIAANDLGFVKTKEEISEVTGASVRTIGEMLRQMRGHEEELLYKDR